MILLDEFVIYSVKSTEPLPSVIINLYDAKKDVSAECHINIKLITVSVLNVHYYTSLDLLYVV